MYMGSIHMSDLCICTRDVISELNFEIEGLHASCALICYLCVLKVVCMCSISCLSGCCVCLRGE